MSAARRNLDVRAVPPEADPFLLALARCVQALEKRYPGGPDQMRREQLAGRANMPITRTQDRGTG